MIFQASMLLSSERSSFAFGAQYNYMYRTALSYKVWFVKNLYPRPPVLSASGVPTKSSPRKKFRKMPVFRNKQKSLIFKTMRSFRANLSPIFENPSHFFAIFGLKNVKISLRNFRISLLDSRITLSNPKISLSDFRRVKIFAEISQFCVHFCQKSRVKTFYFFVKILNLLARRLLLGALRNLKEKRW